MGTGEGTANYQGRLHHGGHWRDEQDFPLPDTQFTPYYLPRRWRAVHRATNDWSPSKPL